MMTRVSRQTCPACEGSIGTIAGGDGIRDCPSCAAGARPRAARPRGGTILRHWTTNVESLQGATRMAASGGDWGLAASRRLNQLGSKLKSLTSRAVAP